MRTAFVMKVRAATTLMEMVSSMMKIMLPMTHMHAQIMMGIPVMIVQRVIMIHQMMDMTTMETVSVTQVTVMMTMTAVRNVGIIALNV
jgi:hypothetical protein